MTQRFVGRLRADTSAIFMRAPVFQTTREFSVSGHVDFTSYPLPGARARAFRFQSSTTALSIRAAMYIRARKEHEREREREREEPPVFSRDTGGVRSVKGEEVFVGKRSESKRARYRC